MISEKNIQKLKEGWTNKSFVKFGKSLVKGGGKKEGMAVQPASKETREAC